MIRRFNGHVHGRQPILGSQGRDPDSSHLLDRLFVASICNRTVPGLPQ